MKRILGGRMPWLLALGILTSVPVWGDDIQVAISGNSAVFAEPGEITGFGISVYSPDEYALFTGSQFLPLTGMGVYNDFLASSFIFGTAGATVTDDFDPFAGTGAGSYTVDPSATIGESVTGTLEVFYDVYSVSPDDPSFDPSADLISLGNEADLAVSVTVGDAPLPGTGPISPTPEPASLTLMALVAGGAFWLKRRRVERVAPAIVGLLVLAAGRQGSAQSPVNVSSDEQAAAKILRTSEVDDTSSCHPDSDPTKISSCCGAPGIHGCITVDAGNSKSAGVCTQPVDNILRTDISGAVNCNRAAAACDPAIAQLIGGPSSGPADQTFYITSDLHFFRPGWTVANQVHHVTAANQISSAGLQWPGTTALVGGGVPIGAPQAIIVAGDLGLDASSGNLGAYRLLWERATIGASIQVPVFFGLGNHDTKTQTDTTGAKRMYRYLTSAMNCGGISMDSDGANGSGNYSWDWNGLHLINLNTFAEDQSSLYSHTSNGLQWLTNDLSAKVGNSGRPVAIIQHYDFTSADSSGNWWASGDVTNFLAAIQNYNVIGLFAGHTHVPAIDRLDSLPVNPDNSSVRTVLTDTKGYEKVLDEFTNGTGGYNNRGDYVAARYHQTAFATHTDSYLDVASVAWDDSSSTPYLRNPTPLQDGPRNDPTTPGGYYGGEAGCHKRVNARFNDVTALAAISVPDGGATQTVTITPPSGGTVFPAPLALQYVGFRTDTAMLTPNFVDSCGIKTDESGSNIPNSRYVQLDDSQVAQLTQGLPVQVTVTFGSNPGYLTPKLVAITPLTGASPSFIDVVTAAAQIPPVQLQDPGPQHFTAFSVPRANYTLAIRYLDPNNGGWLSLSTPMTGTFNQFGRLDVTADIDVKTLGNVNTEQPVAVVDVTSDADPFETIASVSLTVLVKAAVTVSVTANPQFTYDPTSGTPALFTAVLAHPTVPEPANGGTFLPTGMMTLSDVTLDSSGNITSTTPLSFTNDVNGSGACSDEFEGQGIDAAQSLPTDTAVFGSLGNSQGNSGYCPSHTSGSPSTPFHTSTMTLGLHHLVVQYSGDANFVPAISAPFDYLVSRPLVSMSVLSGNGQTAQVGTTFSQSLTVAVIDNSGSPAQGIPVTFSAPASGPSGAFPLAGASSVTVRTGANGAVSPPFAANLTPGSYQVTAGASGVSPVPFNLENTPTSAGAPVLTVTVTSKSGPATARVWSFHVANSGGFAAGVNITQVTFTQVAGTACTPIIQTALPVTVGDLAANASASSPDMTINFGACPAAARFTVNMSVAANGTAYQRTITIGNQFQ